jgi:hypothetical protein
MKKRETRTNRKRSQRGSALLVSLMVLVGLSLLGLGFVAISETESAISVNERNAAQVRNVAEAATKVVVEWFNNPDWALAEGLMPANPTGTSTMKPERKALHGLSEYKGVYKPAAQSPLLFDRPHKTAPENRFFGVDAASADVVIDGDTAATFLAQFNSRLFFDNVEGGQVVSIRVFAPPIIDAEPGNEKTEHEGRFYWNKGRRLGVATIEVTAEKRSPLTGNVIARNTTRAVVAEFPFPGPEGPLQSNSGILTQGAFRVHWGPVIASQGTLALKREMISIPWVNAYHMIHFEYGYDDVAFPIQASFPRNAPFLWELVGKNFEDPWFEARAFGDITTDGGSTANQAYAYTDVNQGENAAGVAGWSNQFQNQDANVYPDKKRVPFPFIDYSFWKQIAIAGQGQDGIFYLRYDPATGNFRDHTGLTKTFRQWVDTLSGASEGYYFFDTIGGVNPQNADGTTNTAVLTPDIDLQGGTIHMRGFIYLNAKSFGSQGLDGKHGYYNYPGEPYRDVGYHQVDDSVDPPVLMYDGAGNPILDKAGNKQWDFQDLNGNGIFDWHVAQKTVTRAGTDNVPQDITTYFIVPYFDGCTPPDLEAGTTGNCSEPHEPYLNLIYPNTTGNNVAACCAGGGQPTPLRVAWEAPGSQSRRPIRFQSDGTTPVPCTQTSSTYDCTSNGYDVDGPLIKLETNKGPILHGVLYNEGKYSSTGNAIMYGSVLVRGLAEKAGTVDVYFDESLVKGTWQDNFDGLPRVLITSFGTDR